MFIFILCHLRVLSFTPSYTIHTLNRGEGAPDEGKGEGGGGALVYLRLAHQGKIILDKLVSYL